MPKRVLIVEDDEKSRRLLADVLGFHGYEVVTASSGEEGLTAICDAMPDIALLDIQLPGMSGFDVLGALRGIPEIEHMPILAVTASVMDAERIRILAAGFNGIVSKPVNIKQLNTILQQALER